MLIFFYQIVKQSYQLKEKNTDHWIRKDKEMEQNLWFLWSKITFLTIKFSRYLFIICKAFAIWWSKFIYMYIFSPRIYELFQMMLAIANACLVA